VLPGREYRVPVTSLLVATGLEGDFAHWPVYKDLPELGDVAFACFRVALDGVDGERSESGAWGGIVERDAQVGNLGETKTSRHDEELDSVRTLDPFQDLVEIKFQGFSAVLTFNDAHGMDMIVMPRHLVKLGMGPRTSSHSVRCRCLS
jgi:hypothetical protein